MFCGRCGARIETGAERNPLRLVLGPVHLDDDELDDEDDPADLWTTEFNSIPLCSACSEQAAKILTEFRERMECWIEELSDFDPSRLRGASDDG